MLRWQGNCRKGGDGKLGFRDVCRGWAESAPERALASAQRAIAVENLRRAVGCGGFDKHVLVTNEPKMLDIKLPNVEIERSPEPFHFGRC